ncbi:unnamed protein product [Polarella glacialis]|uniref:Glycosyltransferase 61 catalytic domain-containing protein n=1 Tax=Polarella glacialis TaxID=89957 RepID=A0A813LNR7_POLGL|nr:unnamed protein product [Polarella glacialis]
MAVRTIVVVRVIFLLSVSVATATTELWAPDFKNCGLPASAAKFWEMSGIIIDNVNKDEQLLKLAWSIENLPNCSLAPLAALALSRQLGLELVYAGHGCQDMDSALLDKFHRLSTAARRWSGPPVEEYSKHGMSPLEWEVHVLTKKLWVMTTTHVDNFRSITAKLPDYTPLVSPATVCIRGATYLAQESLVFAHFVWGHFYPVFVAVTKAGFLHRQTGLIFADRPFMCPRSSWLSFYGLLFDELPSFDETCAGATAVVDLDETVPIMAHYTEELQGYEPSTRDRSTWQRHLAHCNWRPVLNRLARERLGEKPTVGFKVVYLRRGTVGAVGRVGETVAHRNILNDAAVGKALATLGDNRPGQLVTVLSETTDKPWHEQVRLAATANVILGLHGSALAAIELWMPGGGILVSVMSPSICECRFAYCAASNEGRAFLYVLATMPGANCQLGGRWLEQGGVGDDFEAPELHWPSRVQDLVATIYREGFFSFSRVFDYSQLVAGLRTVFAEQEGSPQEGLLPLSTRFRSWAQERGHPSACGGKALQMIDSGVENSEEVSPQGNNNSSSNNNNPGEFPQGPGAQDEKIWGDIAKESFEACSDAMIEKHMQVNFAVIPPNDLIEQGSVSLPGDAEKHPVLLKTSLVTMFKIRCSSCTHPWAKLFDSIIGFDNFLVLYLPMQCKPFLENYGVTKRLILIHLFSVYLALLTAAFEGSPSRVASQQSWVPPPLTDILHDQVFVLEIADQLVPDVVEFQSTSRDRTDRNLAQARQKILDTGRLLDTTLRELSASHRMCMSDNSHKSKGQPCESIPRAVSMVEKLTLRPSSLQGNSFQQHLFLISHLQANNVDLGNCGKNEDVAEFSQELSKLAEIVSDASVDILKELQPVSSTVPERSHMPPSSWEEIFPGATVDGAFWESSSSQVPVDIFKLRNVCIRDLSDVTSYTLLPGDSVPLGRRLELITFGLSPSAAERFTLDPNSRFLTTHSARDATTAVAKLVRNASFLSGLSLFWYDGHLSSLRCPDCSNIDHHMQDDAMVDWITYFFGNFSSVRQVVTNMHASEGELRPKKWFSQLVDAVAADIAPVDRMRKGETICFEEVVLNFMQRLSNCRTCSFYSDNSLFEGYSLRPVLDWVRQSVWRAQGTETGTASCQQQHSLLPCVVAFGRQSEGPTKPRTWLNLQEAADQTNATVIDFRHFDSFGDEVLAMKATRLMLTVVGAHQAAALFMRPGSTWVELSCGKVVAQQWGQAWPKIFAALQVNHIHLEAADCKEPPIKSAQTAWLPVHRHPLVEMLAISESEQVSVCNSRQLCIFRFNGGSSSTLGKPIEVPGVGLLRDTLTQWCSELPVFENQQLRSLLLRCMDWGQDCQSVDDEVGAIYRQRGSFWDKIHCALIKPMGEISEASLRSKRWTTDRAVADGLLTAPKEALAEMRRLAEATTCLRDQPWSL